MDKDMLYWSPASRHQAKPFLAQPCTASNFLQCKCAIKVAACPLARQRYGDMGARCLSQPNLWVVPRASMPWTALKKFGILSAQRARIGIKPFIPASHAENTFPLSAGVSRPYLPPAPNTATETLVLSFFPRTSERRVLLIAEVCYTFSHLHSFSYILIYTNHLHIFKSAQAIFTSSLHHMYTIIFTSSHLSSHLLSFTSTDIIFTSTHIVFTSSHLRISSSYFSHLLSLSFSLLLSPSLSFSLLLSPSRSLSLSLFFSVFFFLSSLFRPGAVPPRRHDMQPFRTK